MTSTLATKNTKKTSPTNPAPLVSGGMFIIGFAGPNPGQFGYRETPDFAEAVNLYNHFVGLGWDAHAGYLNPGAESQCFSLLTSQPRSKNA